MIRKQINIRTVKDILSFDKVQNYHEEWNNFLSLGGNIPEDYRNVVKKPEHVIIGKVWQYEDFPIYRAKVLSQKLSWISMDPPQPIWHEYHYIQAIEQLIQASRRLYFKGIAKSHIGKGKIPNIYLDLKKAISLENKKISIEIIPEIHLRETEEPFTVENHYYSFYNGKNKVLGRGYAKLFVTLRDYEILFKRLKQGRKEASSELVRKIKSQEKKLIKWGRVPKTSLDELVKQIREGKCDYFLYKKLEDFFSLWDLEK